MSLVQISSGPTYRLILKAVVNKPSLKFSFNHHDFGLCYVQDINAPQYHIDLHITNFDSIPYMYVSRSLRHVQSSSINMRDNSFQVEMRVRREAAYLGEPRRSFGKDSAQFQHRSPDKISTIRTNELSRQAAFYN